MNRFLGFFILNLFFFSTSVLAGNLDPPGPPGSTMRTLEEVGSWSKTLPGNIRFQKVLNNEAVLDKETGLVWELAPSNSPTTWGFADTVCHILKKGGRKGWRVPTATELASLYAEEGGQWKLPTGHPFQGVANDFYWTHTDYINALDNNNPNDTTTFGYAVHGTNGDVTYKMKKTDSYNVWCVRGGRDQ